MTLTLEWWALPVALGAFPFVWIVFRKPQHGGYFGDMYLDVWLTFIVCWIGAIGITVGHFL